MNVMLKAVALQGVVTLIAAIVASFMAGSAAAVSVLAGGGSYVLPNFLFALRLTAETKKSEHTASGPSPAVFLLGEFAKLGATVALLLAVALCWPGVHWLALIAGLVVALKANIFAFLIRT